MAKSHLVLLIGILFLSCNQNNDHTTKNQISEFKALTDSLTLELDSIATTSPIPGFAVAIIDKEKIRYQKGFGYADLEDSLAFNTKTINFVASVAKTFIGVAIMKLVENGQLDLDEPINDILSFQVNHPHFPSIPITVRHLVNHTSTLIGDFDPEDTGEADIFLLEEMTYEDDSIQRLMDEELAYYKLGERMSLDDCLQNYLSKKGRWYSTGNFQNYAPGTKYEYSNMGSELAARIVEIKSGMPFNEYTKKYIFTPLKMDNTGWFYNEVDVSLVSKIYTTIDWDDPKSIIEHPKYQYAAYPSGGLKTNLEDWSKYLIEMINGFAGNGKILNPNSYQVLLNPMLDSTYFGNDRDMSALSDEYNVGVFWAVSPTGLRLHYGGSIGVYSFMYFNPKTSIGAIGFCNFPDKSFGKIRNTVYQFSQKQS